MLNRFFLKSLGLPFLYKWFRYPVPVCHLGVIDVFGAEITLPSLQYLKLFEDLAHSHLAFNN